MTSRPTEPPSWRDDDVDPDATIRDLREQLAHAKARMREHRDTMRLAGLTHSRDADDVAPKG